MNSHTICLLYSRILSLYTANKAILKGGGTAAVAGIRPLELILEVNGENVVSAKDFVEKTKGKKDLTFTVRRLTATRMVPIKL